MLISKHTVETTIAPSQIWRVREDVEPWKEWDREIEFSQIDGPFESGTCGWLKMINCAYPHRIRPCYHGAWKPKG